MNPLNQMPYLIGVGLALLAGVFARVVGLDRDRAFYPTVLIVIALLYGLFAVLGGSVSALVAEAGGIIFFVVLGVLGFRYSAWLTVVGLAGHGVYDLFHPHVVANPGVPAYWPQFCMAYDVTAAVFLAWLLWRPEPPRPLT